MMLNQRCKKILLCVTGSIAAYKSAEIVRLLSKIGNEVRIVMTSSAKSFITPLTLQAFSNFPVRDSLWDEEAERAMSHIELAKWADLILIAPATANCIAKLCAGIADDLLTTVCLASTASLFIAPAMNQAMWHHPATQTNITILQERGVIFLGPDEGSQACGDVGFGRMLEPATIVDILKKYNHSSCFLKDIPILITAGPTQEALDPVRYISNHSSGKMGYALAEIAAQNGAHVILVSGPTHLKCPPHVTRIQVKSAQEMFDAVRDNISGISIFIGAAAVADYRAVSIQSHKIKKNTEKERMTIELVKNPDILAYVAALNNRPFVVGFAAETENLLEYAKEKLLRKKLDIIVANSSQAFYADENSGWILTNNATTELTKMSKKNMAKKILKTIAHLKFTT